MMQQEGAIQMQCSDTIRVRVPEVLAGAVKSAAAAKYLSASAYIRQAVADRLERARPIIIQRSRIGRARQ